MRLQKAQDATTRLDHNRLKLSSDLEEALAKVSSLHKSHANILAELGKTQEALGTKSAEVAELAQIRRDQEDTIVSLKGRLSANHTWLSEFHQLLESTSTRAAALLHAERSSSLPPREPALEDTAMPMGIVSPTPIAIPALPAVSSEINNRPRAPCQSVPPIPSSSPCPIKVGSNDDITTEEDARDISEVAPGYLPESQTPYQLIPVAALRSNGSGPHAHPQTLLPFVE